MKEESLLHFDNSDYDYIDSYEYTIIDKKNRIDIPEIVKAFAKPGPKWFEGLFALRNKIASLFKLKTPFARIWVAIAKYCRVYRATWISI